MLNILERVEPFILIVLIRGFVADNSWIKRVLYFWRVFSEVSKILIVKIVVIYFRSSIVLIVQHLEDDMSSKVLVQMGYDFIGIIEQRMWEVNEEIKRIFRVLVINYLIVVIDIVD